jgi:hypothetical protein
MTIVAGSAVGILGVEGWGGFVAYLISQLLVSLEEEMRLLLLCMDDVHAEHAKSACSVQGLRMRTPGC